MGGPCDLNPVTCIRAGGCAGSSLQREHDEPENQNEHGGDTGGIQPTSLVPVLCPVFMPRSFLMKERKFWRDVLVKGRPAGEIQSVFFANFTSSPWALDICSAIHFFAISSGT